jgi:hypothetical protein
MATTTVTPPASAPAAAPSTPAPSTPSTPATPATPAAPVTTPQEPTGDSGIDRIREGWQKAKETVAVEEVPEEPAVEEPPAVETPAAEEPVTEEPATEEPVAQPAAAEELPELDDGTTLAPQDFAKALKGNAEAEKFFNDNPDLKGQVFQALRLVNETREIRQLIPDVETAKEVTQAAATWQSYDTKFLGATTPEGEEAFLNTWVREALIVDDQGNPKVDAQGKYTFHPALDRIFGRIYNNKLDVLLEHADKTGDERLKTAVEIIREVTAPPSPGLDEVPDHLKPYADSVKQREQAVTEKEQAATRAEAERVRVAHDQSIDRAESKAADSVQRQLEPLFKKAGLSKFESDSALRKIGEAVDAELDKNGFYQAKLQSLLNQPPGEDREKAHLKLMLQFTQPIMGRIASQVTREAKSGTLDRQTDRQSQRETQVNNSRSEPRGTKITAPSTQPQSPAEVRAKIVADYKAAHNGDEPESQYVLAEAMKYERARGQR